MTGLVVAAVFLSTRRAYLLRAARPLLDLRILRIASFRVIAGSGSLYRLVISAIPFLLPLFFQEGFGWNSAQAGGGGDRAVPGNVAIKPATTPLMRRFGIRPVLLVATIASSFCLVIMAVVAGDHAVAADPGRAGVVRDLPVVGFSAYNSVAFADVEPERMTQANTLLPRCRNWPRGWALPSARCWCGWAIRSARPWVCRTRAATVPGRLRAARGDDAGAGRGGAVDAPVHRQSGDGKGAEQPPGGALLLTRNRFSCAAGPRRQTRPWLPCSAWCGVQRSEGDDDRQ